MAFKQKALKHMLLVAVLCALHVGTASAQGFCFSGVKELPEDKETKSEYNVTWECQEGADCNVNADVYVVTDEEACYELGYSVYEAKCALYRPSDKTCHLKRYTCDDPLLGVQQVDDADATGGEFVAITLCFHCHKTPQWHVNATGSDAGFDFRDGDDQIVKWDEGDEASCTCTDQRGWICDWECGPEDAEDLPARGEDCKGTRCASPEDACVYTAEPGEDASWTCVPRGVFTEDFCRTFNWETRLWDGDPSAAEPSCAWYPARKQCGRYSGTFAPPAAQVLNTTANSTVPTGSANATRPAQKPPAQPPAKKPPAQPPAKPPVPAAQPPPPTLENVQPPPAAPGPPTTTPATQATLPPPATPTSAPTQPPQSPAPQAPASPVAPVPPASPTATAAVQAESGPSNSTAATDSNSAPSPVPYLLPLSGAMLFVVML